MVIFHSQMLVYQAGYPWFEVFFFSVISILGLDDFNRFQRGSPGLLVEQTKQIWTNS